MWKQLGQVGMKSYMRRGIGIHFRRCIPNWRLVLAVALEASGDKSDCLVGFVRSRGLFPGHWWHFRPPTSISRPSLARFWRSAGSKTNSERRSSCRREGRRGGFNMRVLMCVNFSVGTASQVVGGREPPPK